ncbi:hypothetical protein [Yimella lutea]|nr:hypothetical protein [Yimella lutea]
MSEPTMIGDLDQPAFSLRFLIATSEAAYDNGLRAGLAAAGRMDAEDWQRAVEVVRSAAGGDRHPVFDRLGIDPVRDPWAEVAERLEHARETQRRAVHDSLRGGAA